jgi:hypothetical protein
MDLVRQLRDSKQKKHEKKQTPATKAFESM